MKHFVSLADAAYGVMHKAQFLLALDAWSQCPKEDFSKVAPPVDSLSDDTSDENAELAAVFYRLTRAEGLTGKIALIHLEIFHHQRAYSLAWDSARGEVNPRHRPQRTTFHALRPYEDMIGVLENWAEALHQRACEL